MACLLIITLFTLGTESLVEVKAGRQDIHELVAAGFEIEHFADGIVRGLIEYDRIDDLRRYGFEVKVLYDNYQDATQWVHELPDFGYYHSYSGMCAALESLAHDYPDITEYDTLGFSVQNRAIVALKITDNPSVEEAEASFIFDGDIHGNEIIGGEVVLAMAKKLCYDYGSDTLITRLVDECESWLIPMDNPDGVVLNRRYNANWVDLNRDFGYQWGATGSSPGPFSQPETKVRRDVCLDNYTLNTTHFHSGTVLYIYPWGFTSAIATPDSARMAYIAQRYVAHFPCSYGQIARILYQVYGGSTDHFYGCYGDLAPAVELSHDYAPPPSEIDTIANMNVRGMLDLMKYSLYGIRGLVTDSLTGEPIAARVEIVDNGWHVYSDPKVGDYYHFLLSGTYSVTACASGYTSKTVTGVVVPTNGYVQVDFELALEEGQTYGAYAVPSCRTRRTPTSSDVYFTLKCLGVSDGQSLRLGSNGWIVLDMGPNSPIVNHTGDDLTVVTTTTGQTYRVYVADSLDGNFVQIGQASQTQSFDISSSGLTEARYVRINATGTPALDAVESYMPVEIADGISPRLASIKLIRNPSNRIHFELSGNGNFEAKVFDCQGRMLLKKTLNVVNGSYQYKAPRLPAGVYFLKVDGDNFSVTEKCLIINR